MIDRKIIKDTVEKYDNNKLKVGVLASHSALDVADGAVAEGFKTVCYAKKGREKTYIRYYKSKRVDGKLIRGIVDEYKVYDDFKMLAYDEQMDEMIRENVLFIPNRSFTSYIDLDTVEDKFKVPIVGSRNMLRSEERGCSQDYYWLLEKAGMPFPKKISDPQNIDELCIVKMHHAQKKLERGFFTATSYEEYKRKSNELIKQGVINQESLCGARIEKYVIGPVFNLDFFYNPLEDELSKIELLGVDWRFESSLDGHVRLPAPQQMELVGTKQEIPEMTVCGHNTATIRESLLEKAFELAENFVEASKKHYEPGIIGAFCLQTCIDKDMNYHIYDVAPRIGGGTNVHVAVGHPYGNSLWRKEMSTGRRTAQMIREAKESERLDEIIT